MKYFVASTPASSAIFSTKVIIVKLFFSLLTFIILSSCNNRQQNNIKINSKDSTDKIAVYNNEDKEINDSINKAKATYSSFLKALKQGCTGCENFSVKIRFDIDGTNGEHIWLNSLYFSDEKVFGTIANVPEKVNRVQLGDVIEINKDSLSDWMCIQDGTLAGGYTIKVTYKYLSADEKRNLENEIGAKIE